MSGAKIGWGLHMQSIARDGEVDRQEFRAKRNGRQFFAVAAMDPLFRAPDPARSMRLRSSAFPDSAAIPRRFTCDGEDVSPPLQWSVMLSVPRGWLVEQLRTGRGNKCSGNTRAFQVRPEALEAIAQRSDGGFTCNRLHVRGEVNRTGIRGQIRAKSRPHPSTAIKKGHGQPGQT